MQQKKNYRTSVIATINGVDILASLEDDQLVPIRPICYMLGISTQMQTEKLKSDLLYVSVLKKCTSIGADGKRRKMFCLPYEYCFAWILGIQSLNARDEVREKMREYQKKCISALKEYFYGTPQQMKG